MLYHSIPLGTIAFVNRKQTSLTISAIPTNVCLPKLTTTEKCKYYTEESFQSLTSKNIEFSFIHFNIRSLRKHFHDLICYLESLNHSFDVIALSETWLKDSDDLNFFTLPNFHPPIILNRPNEDGGGVALYINNEFNFSVRDDLTYNSDESQFLFVQLVRKNTKFLIGVTYKQPKTNIESYSLCLTKLLDKLEKNSMNCYIAGDFNIDLLKSDIDERTSSFFNNLSYSFFPSIVKPTRITDASATLIDNIYLNVFDVVDNIQPGILYTDISDHLPVFVIKYGETYKNYTKKITKRVYSKLGEETFMREISLLDWSTLYDSNDPNEQYNYLVDTITGLYNKHFPIKTVRVNSSSLKRPWLTPGILRSIRRKNKLYRAKLRNPSKNTTKFRIYRNKLNHLIRFAKKNYYKTMLNGAQGNIRATWKVINEILNKKKLQPLEVSSIFHNNKRYTKKADIANIFNTFTNVGPSLAKKIQSTDNSYRNWMKISCENILNLPTISQYKVLDQLYGLDCSKAVGHDSLPTKYIKKVAEYICQPLSFVFNTSFLTGIFPDEMKIAKVIPLFKSGSHELVSNFRPISLLPIFSKIFEKIV